MPYGRDPLYREREGERERKKIGQKERMDAMLVRVRLITVIVFEVNARYAL